MKGSKNDLFDSEFLIGWQIHPGIGVGESSQSLTSTISYTGKRVFSACLFPFWALFLIFFDQTGLFFKRNFKICFTFVTEITKISVATQWKAWKTLYLIANFWLDDRFTPESGSENPANQLSRRFPMLKRGSFCLCLFPYWTTSAIETRDFGWLVVDHFCDS